MRHRAGGQAHVRTPGRVVVDIGYGAFLFVATACFVLRQNAHVAAIWDFGYIIESANRIALGQHPYRDFPFPYAPVTFLIQAAIIKLFGRAVFHHTLYAAVTAGAATLLTWRIIRKVLQHSNLRTTLVTVELSLPLIFLSISGSFPHPWYDSDCTLAILLFLWLSLRMEEAGFPPVRTFAAGVLLALPVFIKQNTGGAFLASFILGVGVYVLVTRRWKSLMLVAGSVGGLAVAVAAIHSWAGLANYVHWTVIFAASRRLPGLGLLLGPYFLLPAKIMYLLAFALAGWQWSRRRVDERLIAAMLAIPFLWAIAGLFQHGTPVLRVRNMDFIWPFTLLLSMAVTLWRLPRIRSLIDVLPIFIFGLANGAFLSQGFGGSTFALWPFLVILLACMLHAFTSADTSVSSDPGRSSGRSHPKPWALDAFTAFTCITLVGLGAYYSLNYVRLSYLNLSGVCHRSTVPALRGLTAPGIYVPSFDELVAYTDRTIPRDDAILLMAGEGPFYYATGRTPHFPVLAFDRTVNPYDSEEIVRLARWQNVRWLIIQQDYQLTMPDFSPYTRQVAALMAPHLELVAKLNNFTVYRVKS